MKRLLLVFLFLSGTSAFAQELRVITTRFVGGDTIGCNINCRGSISTNDGGILFVGETDCWGGGGDIPPSPADTVGGGYNLLIGKLDSNLNLSWTKIYGGSRMDAGWSAVQTTDGGYAVLGSTESNNRDVGGMHGTRDFWLVRTDASGNLLWQKCYGSHSDEIPISISLTTDNGFIMMGTSNGYGDDVPSHYSSSPFEVDWFIIKTDSAGNRQWARSIGGTGDEHLFGSILVANDGYYMVSSTESTDHDCVDNSWHPGVATSYDYYVFKLDTAGNTVWAKSYGGTGIEYTTSALLDSRDSSIVINGTSNGSADFMVSGNHGYVDLWTIKIDKHGSLKWQKCLGSPGMEEAAAITVSPFGYIVYGKTQPGTISIESDAWVFALDINGNTITSKIFGGLSVDGSKGISPLKDGFAASGYTGSTSFTEGTNVGHPPTPLNAVYISYINYWAMGLPAFAAASKVAIYPNPATDQINLSCQNERTDSYTITITDVLGRRVFTSQAAGSSREQLIDVRSYPRGVYYVQVTDDAGNRSVQRLVLQ